LNNKFKGNDIKKGYNYDRKKKQDFKQKYEPREPFDPAIYVRNGNVDQAIRTLKKKLLKDNRQKELAKREFYEKPTAKRKRIKAQGIKKHKKALQEKIMRVFTYRKWCTPYHPRYQPDYGTDRPMAKG